MTTPNVSESRLFYLDVDCQMGMFRNDLPTDGLVIMGYASEPTLLDGSGPPTLRHEQPWFNKKGAEIIVEAVTRSMNLNGDAEPRPYYDHTEDCFVFPHSIPMEVGDHDFFRGFEVDGVHLYPIHGVNWHWEYAVPQIDPRPLPTDKVLFVGQDICPFCQKVGSVVWQIPDPISTTEIYWAAHCERPECDTHFVAGFTPDYVQAYTDETLSLQRGNRYQACPRRVAPPAGVYS